jgi:hypothetical protein
VEDTPLLCRRPLLGACTIGVGNVTEMAKNIAQLVSELDDSSNSAVTVLL